MRWATLNKYVFVAGLAHWQRQCNFRGRPHKIGPRWKLHTPLTEIWIHVHPDLVLFFATTEIFPGKNPAAGRHRAGNEALIPSNRFLCPYLTACPIENGRHNELLTRIHSQSHSKSNHPAEKA